MRTPRWTERRGPHPARGSTRRASCTPSTNGPVPVCHNTAPRTATPPAAPRSLHADRLMRPTSTRTPATRSAVSDHPRRPARRWPAASRSPLAQVRVAQPAPQRVGQRCHVAGRQEQTRASPVGSHAERLGDTAHARGQHRQRPRQRLGHDHAVGLGAAGEHEHVGSRRTTPRARLPCGGRPARAGRRGRRSGCRGTGRRRTSGAFVRAPTQTHRQSRSAIAVNAASSRSCPLPGVTAADAQQVPAAVAALGRCSAGSTPGGATWTRAGSRS